MHLPAGVPGSAVYVSLEVDADDVREGDTLGAVLDVHGRFVFQGLPAGTHTLEAWSSWQGRGHHAALEVAAGTRDVELHLEPEVEDDILQLRVARS